MLTITALRRFVVLARILLLGALAGVAVAVLHLAVQADVVPTDRAAFESWATSTDLAGAVLPLLVVLVALAVGVTAAAAALYLTCLACGWVRTAHAIGHVVVPRLRRRLDRLVAVGVVASTLVTGTAARAAYADVVREPDSVTAPVPDIVRAPDPVDAPVTPDAPSVPDTPTVDRDPAPVVEDSPAPPLPEEATPAPGGDSGDSRVVRDGFDAVDEPTRRLTGAAPGTPTGGAASGADGFVREATPSTTTPVPPTAETATPAPSVPRAYTVVEGDNLWAIAAMRLAADRGIDVAVLSERDVASYWVQVVEANRAALRSGNPSLIYAGEVLTLPAS